ncbi:MULTISPECIES: hypothetical protein [unclassified Streptomyces]|uniref:hypothetical protein n=1 Tax=unclassified Streptomyces TaxID=2593676 RepID=UPI0022576DA0|nr:MULTISPECIES: hypothetical protein [unclassified Streptomyces]MCX5052510.1 hypothetical protein [Streptomyces sp. NBC_00474]
MPEEHEEPKTSAEKIDTLFHVVRWPNREQFSNEGVANFSCRSTGLWPIRLLSKRRQGRATARSNARCRSRTFALR